MGQRVVIVGPTGSGKSAQGMALARTLIGRGQAAEIVCVDSMTVYREMDIGTSKPAADERNEIPHHLLDLVAPTGEMTVSMFQSLARVVLSDIDRRGATAILVGGTGLYVDAVVNNLTIPGQFPDVRAQLDHELAEEGVATLHARLASLDPTAADRMEPTNVRRVMRALEVTLGSGRPFSSFGPGLAGLRTDGAFTVFGLRWAREVQRRRIEERFAGMVAAGLVDECRGLLDRHGEQLSRTVHQALGYREVWAHLRGELPLDDALALAVVRTRQFAVRQERWFRRDPRVCWLDGDGGSVADHIVSR